MPLFRALLLFLVLASTAAPPALAQLIPDGADAEPPVTDPFGRTTPLGTVEGLIRAFASDGPTDVLPYLDLTDVPEARRRLEGARFAAQLEAALDRRGELLPASRLSQAAEGVLDDALPADREVFAALRDDAGEEEPLTLSRSEVDGVQVWRVSPETLRRAAAVAASTEAPRYRRLTEGLPPGPDMFGAPLLGWLGALTLMAIAVAVTYALVWVLYWLASRLVRTLRDGAARRLTGPMRLPVALILAGPMFKGMALAAELPVVVRAAAAPVVETTSLLAIAWMVLRLVNAGADELLDSMTRRERLGAVSVVALGRRFAIGVIVIIAAVLVASAFGLNLAGWFAALGIGGLAIALGAQKTVEHMVGGISIIADQPMRVGDFCSVGGLMGTVEDIGLRSTRLRTLDRTLVTIPNGDLSSARIENYTSRDRFLWHAMLGLRYETTAAQMRAIVRQLEIMLMSDDRIAEAPRARFVGFGASSLDIELFAYILAPDYPASLAIREELNLQVMEIVEAGGSSFAFPSQTLYMARDTMPGPEDESLDGEGNGTASPA